MHQLEKEHGFTIFYACETGSRAYNTHTKTSDIDVKGLFIYSKE